MSAVDIYSRLVLEHQRHPRHATPLAASTHAAECANPLCGDVVRVALHAPAGRIEAACIGGESCAIATAAGSMLGAQLPGLDRAGVAALRRRFEDWLAADAAPADPALGELVAFAALRRHPVRHRCALLPFEAVEAALAGNG